MDLLQAFTRFAELLTIFSILEFMQLLASTGQYWENTYVNVYGYAVGVVEKAEQGQNCEDKGKHREIC